MVNKLKSNASPLTENTRKFLNELVEKLEKSKEMKSKKKNNEEEIKKLLIEYRNIINRLVELKVIKTSNVVSGYGEYIASKKLNLELEKNPTNRGYDAIDKQGIKYEIKTRKVTSLSNPSIFPINPDQLKTADFLIYVEFDYNWNLIKLLKIPCSEIVANKYKRVNINKPLIDKYNIL